VEPTSQPNPESSGQERRKRRARIGNAEGWLSLAIIVAPYLMPSVDHPSKLDVILTVVVVFGGASLLALDGFRFGRGSGRVAAAVSLAILSLFLLLVVFGTVMRALWRWD
jgi:hypothetical protein